MKRARQLKSGSVIESKSPYQSSQSARDLIQFSLDIQEICEENLNRVQSERADPHLILNRDKRDKDEKLAPFSFVSAGDAPTVSTTAR